MSFAEKAGLASKYYNIFQNHAVAFLTIALILFALGLFLGVNTRYIGLGVGLIAVCIVMALSTAIADTAPNTSDKNARMTTDKTIMTDDHRMPHYKKLAHQEYKYSKSLDNHQHIKIYESDKKYDKYHSYATCMEHYLKTHNPKSPWINTRIG